MIQGIEHTAIASADPERLAQWYVDHLDFKVNFRPANTRIVFVKAANGSMIEIIESDGSGPGKPGTKDAGLRHLAIAVTDFEAAYERLKAKGVTFLTEPATVQGNTTVFFRDGDGNIVHLLKREKPLP